MTQEEKDLLLKDLCSRLPYGVKVTWDGKYTLTITPHIYCAIASEHNIDILPKLLLRPMSSMTEEQRKEYYNLCSIGIDECGDIIYFDTYESIDYLNKNHFDYRGLIERGLAIDATGL